MGVFSYKPMDNDKALNAQDIFLMPIKEKLEKNCIKPEDNDYNSYIKEFLETLDVTTIKEFINKNKVFFYDNQLLTREYPTDCYTYVITYTYIQYEAFNITDDIKELLKYFLLESIEYFFGAKYLEKNLLTITIPELTVFHFVQHLELTLDNFDKILNKQYKVDEDKRIVHKVNYYNKENYIHFFRAETAGDWYDILYDMSEVVVKDNKSCAPKYLELLKELAKNGDTIVQLVLKEQKL